MGTADGRVEELLGDLPESGYDWIAFKSNPIAVDKSMLSQCTAADVHVSLLAPEWLLEPEEKRIQWLLYPVYLGEAMWYGRSVNFMTFAGEFLELSGVPLGRRIEERFSLSVSKSGAMLYVLSALCDDGTIIFLRITVNANRRAVSTVMRTTASFPLQPLQSVSNVMTSSTCFPCSSQCRRCDCVLPWNHRSSDREVARNRYQLPLLSDPKLRIGPRGVDFRRGMKAIFHESHVIDILHPAGYDSLVGPTPSMYGPRFAKIADASSSAGARQMLTLHVMSLAQRRKRNVFELPDSSSGDGAAQWVKPTETTDGPGSTERATRRFACSLCGRPFARKHELTRHVTAVHGDSKDFSCRICQKAFSLRQNLQAHTRTVHERRSTVECTTCNRLFSTRHKMQSHVRRVHLQQRPYVCELCGYSCFQASDLRKHIERMHGKEKSNELAT